MFKSIRCFAVTSLVALCWLNLSGCLMGGGNLAPVRTIVPAQSLEGQLTGAEIYQLLDKRMLVFSQQPVAYVLSQQGQGTQILNLDQSNAQQQQVSWAIENNKLCITSLNSNASSGAQQAHTQCYLMLESMGDFVLIDQSEQTHYISFRELS